ncbi:MAG TPA: RNase P subunit p30 family protein [Methanoregulaceae archaeon]|nr:RNase P subunit p30 family protein [Methanoregulaceae archaeon]HQJ87695.1 RNase P subunit p30 family protein [Methanoregulaceae archaeon]
MALEAGALGFGAIVAVGAPAGSFGGVRVIPGVSISAPNPNRALDGIRKAPQGAFVSLRLGDGPFNRAAALLPGVHALSGVHLCPKHAFDHVTARTAAERGVAVELLLAPLVQERGPARQSALRRYADVLVLHHRYGFPLVLGSGAQSCLELRAPRAFAALCALFGLDQDGVDAALSGVEGLLAPRSPVRVVG